MPWLVRAADSFPFWEMVKWWLRLLSTILPLVAKLRSGCNSSSLYTGLLCSPSLVTKTRARLLLGPVTVGRVVLVLFLQSGLPSTFL